LLKFLINQGIYTGKRC